MKNCLCTLVCLMLSGCASIIHGPTQQVGFTSEPSGAKLVVAGQTTTTPAYLILERRGKHVAYFSKEGYETQPVELHEGMSLWFLLGNLGFGGIPGWIIDSINGSIGEISPKNVHAVLVPKTQPENETANSSKRQSRNDLTQIDQKDRKVIAWKQAPGGFDEKPKWIPVYESDKP